MLNGIYSSATAMDVASRQHDIIANNLANLNVPGFRRTVLAVETLGPNELTDGGTVQTDLTGTRALRTYTDFSAGPATGTGRPLDVALNGDGFFRLQGPQGDLYTRDGSFQIQPDGQLVTSDGLPVLGTGGPISLPVEVSQNLIRIGTDGQILADGQVAGNLDIVSFEDNKQLTQTGPTRFRADPSAVSRPSDSMVQQGYLEMSNTSAVTEMISMIIGMRHFEAAQQSLRSISEAIRQHATMGMS